QANKRRMEAGKRDICLLERREDVEVSCKRSSDLAADMKQWQQEQEDRIMQITTEDTVLLELERRLDEEKSFHKRECRKLVEERDISSVQLMEVENLRKCNQQKLEELIEHRRQEQQHTRDKDDKVIKGFVLLMCICLFSLWFTFITDEKDNILLKNQLHESIRKLNESLKQQDNLQKELDSLQEASDQNCDLKHEESLGQKIRQLNGVIFERNDIQDKLNLECKSKKVLEIELQEVRRQHGVIQKHLDIALAHQDIMEQKLSIAESQKDYIEIALREAKMQRDELQREIDRLKKINHGECHSGNEETKNNWGFDGVVNQMHEKINEWTKKPKHAKEREDNKGNESQKEKHNIFDILKDFVNSFLSVTPMIVQMTKILFEAFMHTFSNIFNIIVGN
ncbi:unnamed protein product, partial [Meganyctiphanes norvegica]